MLSVKVSSKNQIRLPSEARRRLDIHPGDRLAVDIRDDEIVLRRLKKASERLRGLAAPVRSHGTSTARRPGARAGSAGSIWFCFVMPSG